MKYDTDRPMIMNGGASHAKGDPASEASPSSGQLWCRRLLTGFLVAGLAIATVVSYEFSVLPVLFVGNKSSGTVVDDSAFLSSSSNLTGHNHPDDGSSTSAQHHHNATKNGTHEHHHHHEHHQHKHHHQTVLLPTPMALLRQNYSLATYHLYANFSENRNFSGDCSCRNPRSSSAQCCSRVLRRTHKMGSVMSTFLFRSFPEIGTVWDPAYYNYTTSLPTTDYRDVLLIRNLFDSLVSGYLFHKDFQGTTNKQ